MEAIEQTWNGTSGGTANARCTSTISRNGDLVGRMYLELLGTASTANNPSSISIVSVEVEIGGQRIDKQTGQFMETYAELTEPNYNCWTGQVGNGNNTMTGTRFQVMSGMGGAKGVASSNTRFFVPLQFWFCRNPGLALPLIALQYHEVKIILDHTFSNGFGSFSTNKLWADYIYLDTDERRRFAQVSHEYLIEQVQEGTLTAGAASSELNFNHPVKELIWTKFTDGCPVTICTAADTAAETYKLKLNGHDRFAARHVTYFTKAQVWQHHTGVGGIVSGSAASAFVNGIAVYSFALKPEEHQPSGTCNFSRIDNAQLVGGAAGCAADTIYAINYNVLRVMSGMGGLAYSN